MGSARIWILKHLDATAGRVACRAAGSVLYRSRREIHLSAVEPRKLRRILVIRPGGIGDMLQLTPALRLLAAAAPSARIDLLCERRNRAIAALALPSAGVLCYDGNPLRTAARLLGAGYDVAVDTEQFHNFSAVMASLSGAPVRVGFNINPVRNPAYTHLVDYAADQPEAAQFLRLLRPLGIDPAAAAPPFQGILRDAPLPQAPADPELPARYAAVHAGGSAAFKQWGLDRFAALCSVLRRDHRLDAVIVGDRSDRLAWQRHAGTTAAVPVAGGLSLSETAAVIARAAVFVGGDSGLAHLAVALGVPTVVVFGPSDERKWGAAAGRHAVVTHSVPCRPCCIFGYHKPCHAMACLSGISVDETATAVTRVLQATLGSGGQRP